MDDQDSHGTDGQDGVDIATAAMRLGLSKEAVRKKIARGSLRAVKVGGLWRVILPDVQDAIQDGSGGLQKGGEDTASTVAARLQENLIQVLREEVTFLRDQLRSRDEQLRARDEEIHRAHILAQQAQQQVKLLTDQRQHPPAPPKPRWRRWFSR